MLHVLHPSANHTSSTSMSHYFRLMSLSSLSQQWSQHHVFFSTSGIIIIIIFIKSCQNATHTQSTIICIQHTYDKITAEELGAFVM